jgi:hypothetical protein
MSSKEEKSAELAKKIKAQEAKEKRALAAKKKKAKEAREAKASKTPTIPNILGGELLNIQRRYHNDPGKARQITTEYCKNRKKGLPPVVTAKQIREEAEMLQKYRELEAKSSSPGKQEGEVERLKKELEALKTKKD